MLKGEHSAILSTFIKLPFVINIFVLYIFEWQLKTGFNVHHIIPRQNQKISVSGNESENFRQGRHTYFFLFFFSEKNNFMHFERHFAFQNAYNYIFSRKPENISRFHQ